MNLLSWNCRGLGNPQTVSFLKLLVKEKNPSMIFLMETKCGKGRLEEVRRILGFESCLTVESRGSAGGLAILWKNNTKVSIYNYSRWHISAHVLNLVGDQTWLFTGFYGHPETSRRRSSWEFLKELKPLDPTPWLCSGDFNELTCQAEKVGGPPRPYRQMEMFREALEWCSLNRLRIEGPMFTWTNNRNGINHTKEMLDRALGNPAWLQMFNNASCVVLPAVKSDHSPLNVCLDCKGNLGTSKARIFRFEAAWNLKERCNSTIKKGWGLAAPGISHTDRITRRLRNCSSELKKWNSAENRRSGIK
ncbi:uncharacterized protein LOC122316289 [Carya illinoinensis]|uniref:uncharacterized protein LOC122316289 n=1 Tax=Carya illinoinensis TaxID=32201 RepID=UPI001C72905F|nr:uncharacterized protein LOC122316289 [Carya illinoinensis]